MTVRTARANGLFYMYTPYSRDFIAKIKTIGSAHWDGGVKAWTVPEDNAAAAKEILRACYGEDGDPDGKTYEVRIRVPQGYVKEKDVISFMGKRLAVAYWRDSGARTGDDVVLSKGSVYSGGSAKYWDTIIEKGSEFTLHHVGECRIHDTDDQIEVLSVREETAADCISSLQEEKSRLLERLAKINKLLGE